MSGGSRYWDEETQRWEDAGSPSAAPATPPPPARPHFPPAGWPGTPATDPAGAEALPLVSGPPEAPAVPPPAGWPGAAGTGTSGTSAAGPAGGGEWPPVAEAPTVSAPAGWPGAAGQGVWPLPGAEGAATDDAGRPFADWPNTSWPPAGLPATPAATGGTRRRLVWSVLIGAVGAAVAVALVLTFVVDGNDGKDGDRAAVPGRSTTPVTSEPPEVTSASTEVSESPTETTAPPSAQVSAPPSGYELRQDTEGFRIAVPEGWTRATVDSLYGMSVVNYRSSDRTHRIQVYQVAEPSPKASFELFLSERTAKPVGFTEIGLDHLDDGTFTGSRLEYLADSIRGEPDPGTWHVYDERFVASDGKIYAIAAYGPDSDGRDDELELLTTALDWFCPPLGVCDEGIPQDSTPGAP
ncbi:hypothetical protein [Streptomyces sp. NBC_01451]|uniref:hypothetical protein n=1 Tax=Streptomyces sp. NBC_01451 TaxID=2903872 RepID=UPI002E321E19|nr:hypothetical protein [Streptomyces sp. NBC_01451]